MTAIENDWHFGELKQHTIIWLPVLRNNRRETVEETLNNISTEYEAYQPRTTYLYKSDRAVLEKIQTKIQANGNFNNTQVVHSSSDLGLVYKIETVHKTGWQLVFDGLLIRATKIVFKGRFKKDLLLEKTGVPKSEWQVFNEFQQCVNEAYPEINIESFYSYYTIEETNWTAIGLRRSGDAQLCLIINDPNYMTITAGIYTEWGKDFTVFLGDTDKIHEMLSQNCFISKEISLFINFFQAKYKEANDYRNKLKTDFGGAIAPVYNILKKHKSWNSVKRAMRAIYATKDYIEKAKQLRDGLKQAAEKRWAFFNGPRQIWMIDEEMDYEEKVQQPITNFFEFRLDKDLTIKKIEDQAAKPSYIYEITELENILKTADSQISELYERQRDLLTAFQTEFSLYGVWFAIGAIVIAILSLLIPR